MVRRLFRLGILLLLAPAIYVLADEARSFFAANAQFLLQNGFLRVPMPPGALPINTTG